MPVLESSIEHAFVREIKRAFPGAEVIKMTSEGQTGLPDRLVLLPNVSPIWVELKRPGKEPSPKQHYWLDRLRQLGQLAVWADSVTDAVRLVKEERKIWLSRFNDWEHAQEFSC